MKGRRLKAALLGAFIMGCMVVHAQEATDAPQNESKDGPTSKAMKVQQKKQKEREKQEAKATKALLKQHMKDQKPEVRKRMKEDAHKANLYNEHKREFFLKRWFSKKKEP